MNTPQASPRRLALLGAALTLLAAGAAEPRSPVGQHVTPAGMLLARSAPGQPWRSLKEKEDVYSGDLLVALPGAAIESANQAVRLTLLTDLDDTSPYPIMESAVILHSNNRVDLDFTLDRGRVDVANLRKQGEAKVVIHFHGEKWNLTLKEPGTRVAFELYGRWAPGKLFRLEPTPDHKPVAHLVALVIQGEATLDHGSFNFLMSAPPGPALFQWDSLEGPDPTVKRLEKLPDWADAGRPTTERGRELQQRIERLRQRLTAKSVAGALAETLDTEDWRIGVTALGATDNLWDLLNALSHPDRPEVRDHAVTVLRHWIGRAPGQDRKLYDTLVQEKKFTPAVAESIMHLLHSLDEQQLGRPEPYAILIAYLMHDMLPVRHLAQWHLYRLVPAGKNIAYDAAAPYAERKKAHDEWKKLIPDDKLPPTARPDEG